MITEEKTYLAEGTSLHNGKYTIDHVLAQGGFGITYLSIRNEDSCKIVIKEYFRKEWHTRNKHTSAITVNSGTSNLEQKFRKKFEKEANTIMRLNHPNIVKVYEFFEENGTLYYSMEYIDGVSISEYVRTHGKFNETQALVLIRSVAETLGYIHSNNQLHLDITPRNIMLTKEQKIVLIDFGVSKHYSEEGAQSTTTPVAHSAGYAPKEQYLSDGVIRFSPATDIYALAATFYFMLTATTPPNANERQQFLEEGRDILAIPHTLSQRVQSAIQMGMTIARNKRLQTTRQFLETLDGISCQTKEEDTQVITEELVDTENYDSEIKVLENLKAEGQYKEAYNYCLDLILQGKAVERATAESEKLIPLIGQGMQRERLITKIIIVIVIIVSIISIAFPFIAMWDEL